MVQRYTDKVKFNQVRVKDLPFWHRHWNLTQITLIGGTLLWFFGPIMYSANQSERKSGFFYDKFVDFDEYEAAKKNRDEQIAKLIFERNPNEIEKIKSQLDKESDYVK